MGETVFRKMLKDYPRGSWMDAADGCEECGATYKVKVIHASRSGFFGTVAYRINHLEHCSASEDYVPVEDEDIAGWRFQDKPYNLGGKVFYPLKSRANVGPCLSCGKLIIGVPLILFIGEGKGGELDFCFKCADQLGILGSLVRS